MNHLIIHTNKITAHQFDLVGVEGSEEYYLHRAKIRTNEGIVLTTNCIKVSVLQPELIDNLSSYIKKNKLTSKSLKGFYEIVCNFVCENFSSDVLKEIEHEIMHLRKGRRNFLLSFYPSYSKDERYLLQDFSGVKQEAIDGGEVFENALKNVFAKMLYHYYVNLLTNNKKLKTLSAAILIKVHYPLEVSGKAYYYKRDVDIYAQYGEPDASFAYADHYVFAKEIFEKHIAPQKEMNVISKNKIETIKVPSEWILKQKLDDKKIHEVGDAIDKIREVFPQRIEIEFGYHEGQLYVTDLNSTGEEYLLSSIRNQLEHIDESYLEKLDKKLNGNLDVNTYNFGNFKVIMNGEEGAKEVKEIQNKKFLSRLKVGL